MSKILRVLNDADLLFSTKELVQREREITTEVLRHLREIERRKLYCDLKYSSLFDYAVHELGYSEPAAGRRIQAMRLMTEIPEVEAKIESGALNLSNICQAQGFFRELKKAEPSWVFGKDEKMEVLARLEEKSAREGQKILLALAPPNMLPRERERMVSPEHSEVSFVMGRELRDALEEVRSLLGRKGAGFSFAELVLEMARLSAERLRERRFGKRRVARAEEDKVSQQGQANKSIEQVKVNEIPPLHSDVGVESQPEMPRRALSLRTRYIPQAIKFQVWRQAKGQCTSCGSRRDLNFDHVRAFALGGHSSPENLQLLCSSCNLRRGVQTFGTRAMKRD